MAEKILITGATGTVARATARELKEKGYKVIGISRSIEEGDEDYTNTLRADLLKDQDLEELKEMLEDVDAVFHLAWNLSVENYDTGEEWEGNIEMFENIIEISSEAGVPIFINGSSIHAGTGSINAYTVDASLEDTPEPYRSSIDPEDSFDLRKEKPSELLSPLLNDPDSPYGESKIETEKKLKKAVENGDFRIGVSIRIGGVNDDNRDHLEGEPYYSSLYWSHEDIGNTLEGIITADLDEKSGYHQFYGVSDNEGRIFSIEDQFSF